jgi:hypothetical protein
LRLVLYLKVNEVLFEVVLYVKRVKYIDKCSMPYTLHDSLASEVGSWPMVRPYRYNLASYVAQGGVWCGFICIHWYALRGMKAEDICIAFICIHWSDICRWCGFIPLEVWRQSTYTLHSYAYIEVIFAGFVDAEKCYRTYDGCSMKWDGIGYIGTSELYIYKYFWS